MDSFETKIGNVYVLAQKSSFLQKHEQKLQKERKDDVTGGIRIGGASVNSHNVQYTQKEVTSSSFWVSKDDHQYLQMEAKLEN